MTHTVRTILFSTIAILWFAAAPSVSAQDRLSEATAAYGAAQTATDRDTRNREFTRAALLFEQAARDDEASADLWTNAGNARLQSQSIGRAILSYRRALLSDPRHPRAQQNIAHARSLLPAWVPRQQSSGVLDTFFFWHRTLSRGDRAAIGAVAFLLLCVCIGLAVGWQRRSLRGVAVIPLLFWLGSVGSLLAETGNGSQRPAVIVVDETIARASDSINAAQRFSAALPAGTEIAVLEERPRFTHIRLANERDGWIPRSSYELVSD